MSHSATTITFSLLDKAFEGFPGNVVIELRFESSACTILKFVIVDLRYLHGVSKPVDVTLRIDSARRANADNAGRPRLLEPWGIR